MHAAIWSVWYQPPLPPPPPPPPPPKKRRQPKSVRGVGMGGGGGVMVVVDRGRRTHCVQPSPGNRQNTSQSATPDTPADCHSGLIISQPVSSGRVALLPVVTDTQTKGEATLRRQERCTFHVLITSSDTAISDSWEWVVRSLTLWMITFCRSISLTCPSCLYTWQRACWVKLLL